MRRPPPEKRHREPTITLINVVFLMLIFFLIAGTLAPPLDPELDLVDTKNLEGREPPDALVIDKTGALSFRGTATDVEKYVNDHAQPKGDATGFAVRVVPDRDLPAEKLLEIGRSLQNAGAKQVFLVTERALQ